MSNSSSPAISFRIRLGAAHYDFQITEPKGTTLFNLRTMLPTERSKLARMTADFLKLRTPAERNQAPRTPRRAPHRHQDGRQHLPLRHTPLVRQQMAAA